MMMTESMSQFDQFVMKDEINLDPSAELDQNLIEEVKLMAPFDIKKFNYNYIIVDGNRFKQINSPVYEFIGPFLIVFGFMFSAFRAGNIANAQFAIAFVQTFAVALGMQQTGAQNNPCFTAIAYWQGKIPALQLLITITAQLSGGICAGFLFFLLTTVQSNQNQVELGGPWPFYDEVQYNKVEDVNTIFKIFFSEAIGTFIQYFFFSVNSQATTKLTTDFFGNILLMYFVTAMSRNMANYSGSVTQPPIFFSYLVVSGVCGYQQKWEGLEVCYLFALGPLFGAYMSHIVYQKIYLPSFNRINKFNNQK